MKTLNEIKIGKKVKVQKIEGESIIKRRIMDMGITKGVELFIRKTAPFGDPIQIFIRGYELTIRKEDAKKIFVFEEE